jgi:hypothetical protein
MHTGFIIRKTYGSYEISWRWSNWPVSLWLASVSFCLPWGLPCRAAAGSSPPMGRKACWNSFPHIPAFPFPLPPLEAVVQGWQPHFPLAQLRLVAHPGRATSLNWPWTREADLSLALSAHVTLGINLSDLYFNCNLKKLVIPSSGLCKDHMKGAILISSN